MAASEPRATPIRSGQLTALLIEDNPGDALLIKAMLADAAPEEFRLIHADRLQRGLSLLAEQGADVVLLDLSLPDSSGLDTFDLLAEHAPELPVIVLTGLSDRSLALQALDRGAQDYLVKDEVNGAGLVKAMNYAIKRKQAETRLRESEHRYKALFQSAPDGLLLIRDGRISDCNSRAAPLFGLPREQLLGRELQEFSAALQPDHQEPPSGLVEHLRIARERGNHFFEWCFERRDGSLLYTEVNLDSVYLYGKQHLLAIVRDLSERMQAEERIRFQASMLNQVRNAVIATDLSGNIVYWNAYATTLHQFEFEEARGRNAIRLLMNARSRSLVADVRRALTDTYQWEGEVELRRRDGTNFPAHMTLSPIRNTRDEVIGFASVSVDITERKEIERRLTHSAFHDTLTGLPNRALFNDRLTTSIARNSRSGHRYAVMLMDMDGFKSINDTLGHLVGDELLIQFSRRVESCLRPGDTLARLGGDEFTILLEDIKHGTDAVRVADRIHEQMSRPFLLAGKEVRCTTSIGITFDSPEHREPSHALRDADMAMYRAKENGKGCHVIFESGMHERAVSQLRREGDLKRALERDEFLVEFQPIIELDSGDCVGCEALLRWQHPRQPRLSAREFIGMAEDTGMIVPLGEYVLERACAALATWRRRFDLVEDFSLHVNMSAREFFDRDLPARLARLLGASGLDGRALTLELREQTLTLDEDAADVMLRRLRELDVRVCIDDFGTGAAPLSYLRRFSVDAVKLDRSFVGKLGEEVTSGAIIGALLGLAQNLGMNPIAEGVETAAHEQHLRALGCRHGQGNLFYPPMSSTALESALLHRAAG